MVPVIDWTSQVKPAGAAAPATPLTVTRADDTTYCLTLAKRMTRVSAMITELDLFDFVTASNGSIAYESTTADVVGLGLTPGTDLVGATLSRIAITVGTLSIGAGGIGITVTGGQLYVASITPAAVADTRSWRTIESSLSTGSLTGIEGLMLELATIQVKLNQAVNSADPTAVVPVIDWTSQVKPAGAAAPATPLTVTRADDTTYCLTLAKRMTRVSAMITELDLFDFVTASNGSIAYESTTADVVGLGLTPGTDLVGATLSRIAITVGTLSIGAGGIGITVTGGQLYVAWITPAAVADTRSWRTIESSLSTGCLTGIEGLVLELATIQVKLNQAVDSADPTAVVPVIDWTSQVKPAGAAAPATPLTVTRADDTTYSLTLATRMTRVSAMITELDLFGFVTASNGSIAYESTTADVVGLGLTPGTDLVGATLSRIAITVGTLSIGAGGIGITVTGGQLYVASITPAAVADTRSWRTIESSLSSGQLTGIEGLTLERREDSGQAQSGGRQRGCDGCGSGDRLDEPGQAGGCGCAGDAVDDHQGR